MISTQHQKEYVKLVRSLSHKHSAWRVFADAVEMGALALVNGVFRSAKWEQQYLAIAKGYDRAELETISRMLAHVVMGLDEEPIDFLGGVFHELELQNHWTGQFFTPLPVAECMARLVVSDDDVRRRVETGEPMSVLEPACGAGAMVIAIVRALKDVPGWRSVVHATCIDIDRTAVFMCLTQLAALNVPAIVCVGDSLRNETTETYATPAHALGRWSERLKRREEEEAPVRVGPDPAALAKLAEGMFE